MDRWDEIFRLSELLKQDRWADIKTICDLARQGRWDDVTVRLAEMTATPESRNLFNESMLTSELKDMYQNDPLLENELSNIAESRAKKLYTAQIDVLKANALRAFNSTNPSNQTSSQDVESISNEKLAKLFYEECEKQFVEEYHLICGETPGDDGKYSVYIWEGKFCHYRRVENFTELHSRLKKVLRSISSEMGYDRSTLLTDQKTKDIVDSLIYKCSFGTVTTT